MNTNKNYASAGIGRAVRGAIYAMLAAGAFFNPLLSDEAAAQNTLGTTYVSAPPYGGGSGGIGGGGGGWGGSGETGSSDPCQGTYVGGCAGGEPTGASVTDQETNVEPATCNSSLEVRFRHAHYDYGLWLDFDKFDETESGMIVTITYDDGSQEDYQIIYRLATEPFFAVPGSLRGGNC